MTEQQQDALFIELLYGSRYLGSGPDKILNRISDLGLRFKTEKDFKRFIQLHQAFHNNTRMQCNRGYTPTELFAMHPKESRVPKSLSLGPNIRKSIADGTINSDELLQSILTLDMPSEELRLSILKEIFDAKKEAKKQPKPQKVGRNAPCPCGSGKKYKNCCGK